MAAVVAAFALLPLAGLAAWALALRYGWTVQRITAVAVVAVAARYAVGYASAAVRSPGWMKRIEITNFVTAYVVIACILVWFSPFADPSRLMVADQMQRLKSGKVSADKFDFAALRFDGARWGAAALDELGQVKDGPDAENIARRAAQVIAAPNRFAARRSTLPVTPEAVAARVLVYPAGRVLRPTFPDGTVWPKDRPGSTICFQAAFPKCIARFVALRPGKAEAILFVDQVQSYLVEQDVQGTWRETAAVNGLTSCPAVRQAWRRKTLTSSRLRGPIWWLEDSALSSCRLAGGARRFTGEVAVDSQWACHRGSHAADRGPTSGHLHPGG